MRGLIIVVLLISGGSGFAQQIRVSGHVREMGTKEALHSANIYDSVSGRGTAANAYGYFNITVGATNAIRFSFAGYRHRVLRFSSDTTIHVFLEPVVLDTVYVSAGIQEDESVSTSRLPVSFIRQLPMILGEPDVLKALATMPGVATGSEGNSNLLVRGGTPDQNLILLDDAPVYNVSHLFGFVSVFNVGAVRDVSLLRGSFPAKYGGRLSSVLEVNMKEGSKEKREGEFGIGLVSSRFNVGGPIAKGKSSYFFSGRASYLGLLLLPTYRAFQTGRIDQYFNYTMYDFNFKANHEFSKKSQLFVSSYIGHDFYKAAEGRADMQSRFGLDWGNQTGTIRYQTQLTPALHARAVLLYTRYVYDVNLSFSEANRATSFYQSKSFIQDYTAKTAFEWYPSRNHSLDFGGEYTLHTYNPARLRTSLPNVQNVNPTLQAGEYALYVQDQWVPNNRFSVRTGLRYSAFSIQQTNFSAFEPRLNVRWKPRSNFLLEADFSRMRQYLHLLSGNSAGLSNDIWVPAVPEAPPQTANQWSLGLRHDWSKFTIRFDSYYKTMTDVAEYRQGTNFLLALDRPWQEFVEAGGLGRAYGFETMLEKKGRVYSGWISYTLSWNYRQFPGISNGAWFPARFDRRHNLVSVNQIRLNKSWNMTATWFFATGHAVTLPVALITDLEGQRIPVYEKRNNARMPVFHRLDIGFNYEWRTKRNREASLGLGVYNAYNRANPLFIDFSVSVSRPDPPAQVLNYGGGVANRVGAFPFLPFVSYSVKL